MPFNLSKLGMEAWKHDSTSISKDVKDADRVPEGKITQKELID